MSLTEDGEAAGWLLLDHSYPIQAVQTSAPSKRGLRSSVLDVFGAFPFLGQPGTEGGSR